MKVLIDTFTNKKMKQTAVNKCENRLYESTVNRFYCKVEKQQWIVAPRTNSKYQCTLEFALLMAWVIVAWLHPLGEGGGIPSMHMEQLTALQIRECIG